MSASLVGSEMCIRDSLNRVLQSWGLVPGARSSTWSPCGSPDQVVLDLTVADDSEWGTMLHSVRGYWRAFRLSQWLSSPRREALAAALTTGRVEVSVDEAQRAA
eukprot:12964384-Alexandrium_andersonii.AAC.1